MQSLHVSGFFGSRDCQDFAAGTAKTDDESTLSVASVQQLGAIAESMQYEAFVLSACD